MFASTHDQSTWASHQRSSSPTHLDSNAHSSRTFVPAYQPSEPAPAYDVLDYVSSQFPFPAHSMPLVSQQHVYWSPHESFHSIPGSRYASTSSLLPMPSHNAPFASSHVSSLDGALDESHLRSTIAEKPAQYSHVGDTAQGLPSRAAASAPTNRVAALEDQRSSCHKTSSFVLARPGTKRREYKKNHACQICHKTFPRPSGLKTHMNTHDQVRPFRCLVEGCDKTFTVKSNCKRHMRTHGVSLEESSRRFEEYSVAGRRSSTESKPSGSDSADSSPRSNAPPVSPASSVPVGTSFGLPYTSTTAPVKFSPTDGGAEWEETWEYFSEDIPISHPAQRTSTHLYTQPAFSGGQPLAPYPMHTSCHW